MGIRRIICRISKKSILLQKGWNILRLKAEFRYKNEKIFQEAQQPTRRYHDSFIRAFTICSLKNTPKDFTRIRQVLLNLHSSVMMYALPLLPSGKSLVFMAVAAN